MNQTEIADCEDKLLAALDDPSAPLPELLDTFKKLVAAVPEKLPDFFELLKDRATAARDIPGLIGLFRIAAEVSIERNRDAAFRAECLRELGSMAEARRDRHFGALLRNAGFDKDLALAECLRRLDVLRSLAPGVLCMDRSRGFGVVGGIDEFAQQVIVDYEAGRGHRLGLGYAAECLNVLDEDHLFAVRHCMPERMAELVKNQPVEVVKMALRDFGALTASQLQDTLMGPIVPPDSWKTFWDNARKHLKADPGVDMPARRSEPIRLLNNVRMFDAAWFEKFAGERDLARILEQVEQLVTELPSGSLSAKERGIVIERLSFVARGAFLARPEWRVNALLFARQLGAAPAPWIDECLKDLLRPEAWSATLPNVSIRALGPLLEMLFRSAPEAALARLRESAPDLPASTLGGILTQLDAFGHAGKLDEGIRARMSDPRPPVELVLCLAERLPLGCAIVPAELLAGRAFGLMEDEAKTGGNGRAINQLHELLSQPAWWIDMFALLSPDARQELAGRMNRSEAWAPHERRAIIKAVLDAYPETTIALNTPAPAAPLFAERVTSLRAYRERQVQLNKIVSVDLPQSARDIGIARSYGDLRENYEYKAAREAQAQLMRRQEELERDLSEIRPVAFDGPAPNLAGIGAAISLRHADGRVSCYTILGEWDHDDALGIISCASALARAVQGHGAGDHVDIPTESGARETCLLESVGPMPEKIRAWLKTSV